MASGFFSSDAKMINASSASNEVVQIISGLILLTAFLKNSMSS
jgi:hypothetical protein